MKLKRLTSLLIAGCMMVSMLPASAVTAFAEEGSDIGVYASDGITTYDALVKAIADASDGDTITLGDDIDVTMTLAVSKTLTLDLNGHKLSNTIDLWDNNTEEQGNNWSLVSVRENGDLTITGNGKLAAKANDCYAVDVQDETAKLTIESGTFIGNIHAVYVESGEATIKGGHYSVQQKFSASLPDEYVLNLYDTNRAAGTAKMTVMGGEFEKFNPANCYAEGKGTNFCAPGYKVEKNGDVYTVSESDVSINARVDTNPDDEPSGSSYEGEIDKPVEIAVTATGSEVARIEKLSLDFGDDFDKVGAVQIEKEDKIYSLEKFKSAKYQNMPLDELYTDEVKSEEPDTQENGILDTLSSDNDGLKLNLRVTYTDNGRHEVTIKLQDENSGVVAQTEEVVQIGPKAEDDTSSSSKNDDAGAAVAAVAIGTGVAVLTYHVGTELYAKQVLGAGVAVPKTREDVALKAWELAGKPAVAAEGETLSDTEQAERWVVESGLMKNDANGNFNGQKKMLKLVALRTLDAAKKLG